ncbi:restriction endonuclease subunit S [Methylotuvimicrobium sp. KM1]|uniref:restriction endonuclease subunit S n=1 Tax=Methylotuvimicrobium sp. KM1 TaxID=3377707 RepID=UPI00384E93DB
MESEWRECKLGEQINLKRGYDLPNRLRQDGDIPIFSSSGVTGFHNEKMCDAPGVITGRYGTIGQIFFSKKPYWPLNTTLYVQDFKGNDELFVYYFLKRLDWEKYSDKSAVPGVNRNDVHQEEIELPPLSEQKAIAAVLSSLDDKIDLLHRQNKTLEAMAETLFRQRFIDKEIDGTISQLISIQNGFAFKSKDFRENGTKGILKIKNISGGIIDIQNTDFIDDPLSESISDRFLVKTGDILIGMTGAEIGKLGIVPKNNKVLWLNQRVGLLKEKYKGSNYLAYIQLKSDFGQDFIENAATGSAQPNISSSEIENCGFPAITEKQIKEYSEEICPFYEKLIINLGQIRTLEKLRDTLLPKLMSGEVRIAL